MEKKQGRGKLLPLPFATFGEMAALDLKATVYCSVAISTALLIPLPSNFATVDSRQPDFAAARSATPAMSAAA
jgi:hypothetical protein